MTKRRESARLNGKRAGSPDAKPQDSGLDPDGAEMDDQQQKQPKIAPKISKQDARHALWEFFRAVCLMMLKIAGFKKWEVEGKGDCSILAACAGTKHLPDPKTVKAPSAPERKLVSETMRKGGVELLATGKHPDDDIHVELDEGQLVLVGKRLDVLTTDPKRRTEVCALLG